jgi:hypothetical protein
MSFMVSKSIPFIISFFFLLSCKTENKCTNCNKTNKKTSEIIKDTIIVYKENPKEPIKIISEKKEDIENLQKIEKIYGEQWDFCTCVTANDSINTAFEKELTDAQSEKLMARWEKVETKCKEFLIQPSTTPEDRLIHELKVKKCLKNASKQKR